MKGVIFTEFLDYVEAEFSSAVTAQLEMNEERGQRRYVPLGSYDLSEFSQLINRVSAAAEIEPAKLLRGFGRHLFQRFAALYPVFLANADSALGFLEHIDTAIHAELHKLYPDAQFPSFECIQSGPDRLEMIYRSQRALPDFAEGLILGCVAHFNEPVELQREDLSPDGRAVRFILARVAH